MPVVGMPAHQCVPAEPHAHGADLQTADATLADQAALTVSIGDINLAVLSGASVVAIASRRRWSGDARIVQTAS